MTKLAALRAQLAVLRRRRRNVRLAAALAAFAAVWLWVLLGAMLADWLLNMDRVQRLVLLGLVVAAGVWAWRRFALPGLRVQETEVDLALAVQRQHQIDSDLVAALQFELPEARGWGSPQLEEVVIEQTAQRSRQMNVAEGFSQRDLLRRTAWCGAAAAVVLLAAATFPQHTGAFLQRLLLSSRRYPTKTHIQQVMLVCGHQKVEHAVFPPADAALRAPERQPLLFRVRYTGEDPTDDVRQRRVLCRTQSAGREIELPLTTGADGVLSATLPQLVDALSFQVFVGDDFTDPATVELTPLPVVEVVPQITPPAYAAHRWQPPNTTAGARHLSVMEGSRVAFKVTAVNKPLRKAILTLDDGEPIALRRLDDQGQRWGLPTTDTPLAHVLQRMDYAIQVEDIDGLHLEQPIKGKILIKSDQRPRVVAGVVTQYVLPQAKPKVGYEATDDFGVAEVRLHCRVERQAGGRQDYTEVIQQADPRKPAVALRGSHVVDLAALAPLEKGDRILIDLEVADYRGDLPAQTASLAEPIVLRVTDERGVLAAMIEADKRSYGKLESIIQRQLGIGEGP